MAKITLASLKKISEEYFNEKEYEKLLEISEKTIKLYSKNMFGYKMYVIAITNDFTKYISEDNLKDIKSYYKMYTSIVKKEDSFNSNYNEYILDIKEVENLKKIKKELTSKFLLKRIYEQKIIKYNKDIVNSKKININGKKNSDVYDLIGGMFFLFTFIFNLIYPNYLIIITACFGLYGLITIYKYIDDNIIKNKPKFILKNKGIILEKKEKITECNNEIIKIKESIYFLNDQKLNAISKIPESFNKDISIILENDEKSISRKIMERINNEVEFILLINENTNLSPEDIFSEKEFISNASSVNLNKDKKLVYMKKITKFNVVISLIAFIFSIFTFIVIKNNFYELNYKSFVIGYIVGIITCLLYNINNGKNNSYFDSFNDNLIASVFTSSLIYDLVYYSITKDLGVTYNLLEIPIIFLLLLVGYVSLVTLLKYKNLLNKLRRK